MTLKVKNWEKYQHYKNRCPPWIKLHVNILNDRRFSALSCASKGLLMQLWILASEDNGKIPYDLNEIRFRLRDELIKKEELNLLIEKGFLKNCKQAQADASECFSETETETETDKNPAQESGHFKNFITDEWLKAINEIGKELEAKRFNAWKWIQKMLGQKKHPGAVHECLYTLLEQYDIIKEPYGFLNHLIKVKDWNWWEKDRISEEQKEKIDFQKMAKEFEAFCKSKP